MSLKKLCDRVIETDVIVMGGGIAGCCAAAEAAKNGLKVTLVEKSKVDRSGSTSQGIDSVGPWCRDRSTPLMMVEAWQGFLTRQMGPGRWFNQNILYNLHKDGDWTLTELERLGVTMKWDGDYLWKSHPALGKVGLRVHWKDVKPEMARAVRKAGVNVLNRTMVVDLLTNKGKIVGATVVDTRTGEFIVIKAKAVVVSTGVFSRGNNPATPLPWRYKLQYHWCPASVSGDGYAVAYRAGAVLSSMDISSGGTFTARDDSTLTYGSFPNNTAGPAPYLTWKGEEIPHVNPRLYAEMETRGLTPIYLSLEDYEEDFQKRVDLQNVDERLISLKFAEERGFNSRTHRYELMPLRAADFFVIPGVNVDENCAASLKGLYSAGDCTAGLHSCSQALQSGFFVADNLPAYISSAGEPAIDEGQVESQKQAALAPLSVKDGTPGLELECTVRYITERYSNAFKSEGLLREGQRRLGSLRREFLPKLMARTPHELMRCLEARNILGLMETHFASCLARNETRASYIRVDYPEKDPSLDGKVLFVQQVDGNPVVKVGEMPALKPEYAKENK